MKSISVAIEAQGAPSVMKLSNVDIGLPKEGEVLIRQSVIGVNYMDIYQRSGYYPMNLPSGIGLEASGIIESIGAGVNFLTEGDRVVYSGGPPGSYADLRNVLASRVVRIPENIEDEQAAAIFLKGTTAEYLLERAYPITAGQTVLFHAAAGGVGLIAGQWGKAIGARMIGVAGGPKKCALAKEHGYTEVIDRNNENVVARVKELTDGEGVPVRDNNPRPDVKLASPLEKQARLHVLLYDDALLAPAAPRREAQNIPQAIIALDSLPPRPVPGLDNPHVSQAVHPKLHVLLLQLPVLNCKC